LRGLKYMFHTLEQNIETINKRIRIKPQINFVTQNYAVIIVNVYYYDK
jgi:hypothetical protein